MIEPFDANVTRVPLIRLWDFVLVPIQGNLTDRVAQRMCDELLGEIEARGARGVILDVAGAEMMDSHLCSVIAHLGRAARFMGATTVISGISAEIAMTLEAMGLELEAGRTTRGLEEALASFGIYAPGQGAREDEAFVQNEIMNPLDYLRDEARGELSEETP